MSRMKDIMIAAPDGQAGGGMGRVKDYILRSAPDASGRYRLVPLVTRDGRGMAYSVLLLFRGIARVVGSALRGRAALLHVNMGDRGSLARKGLLLMTAHWVGSPTVLHLHAAELEAFYARSNWLKRWLIRRPFLAATCIVVLGERYRHWVQQRLGISDDKIRILYNGVAAAQIERKAAEAEVPQTLLFLGNLIERKGVSDLLRALGRLPADAPTWRAVFVGGGDIAGYQALAAELGIADRVDFPGWANRAGVDALFGKANALILPSYDEGLPLVILEAMGAGLPVICTPVGVISEVLDDGDTALFVEPGDQAALADRILTLLTDRNLQMCLSVRARELFQQQFSLEAFQTALFAIYSECCGVRYVLDEER